jgi:hypothetical protein
MPYSIHQEFDPLRVCVVGRSYPPEYYHWIELSRVRELFEKMARETEEDFQILIAKLESFGVTVFRPNVSCISSDAPPIVPRDHIGMIGNVLYHDLHSHFDFETFYANVRDPSWPDCKSLKEFDTLPEFIKAECEDTHKLKDHIDYFNWCGYGHIFEHVASQGNSMLIEDQLPLNGAMAYNLGYDRYFGTTTYDTDLAEFSSAINKKFPNTRNHIINSGGHLDGTFCMPCPGLIISLTWDDNFDQTHPGWEVVRLPQSKIWDIPEFVELQKKNNGNWWIPGWEHDEDVIKTVESKLKHWTGSVKETVFALNMLIIDSKNVIVSSYDKLVFDTLARYGITPHIVPFRWGTFWDAGIHCITADLHREGSMQNYFPRESD